MRTINSLQAAPLLTSSFQEVNKGAVETTKNIVLKLFF